jgi:toxin ParE1/3/4
MELVFDDEAVADLENIYSWIAADSPSAAKKVVQRLFSSSELLICFPFMGMPDASPVRSNGSFRDCLVSHSMKSIG